MDLTTAINSFLNPDNPLVLAQSLFFGFLKILFLVGFGIYIVFALTIVSQVRLMTKTLKTGLEGTLSLFAFVHLLVAIGVWIFALLSL